MYTKTKQVAGAILALQVIVSVAAQQLAIDGWNVTTRTQDYIIENRRQYNATLQSYLDEMDDLKNSLELQLVVLEKQSVLVLNKIKETNEQLDPLEVLSIPSKYCVQKYRSQIPFYDDIKTGINNCISNGRSFSSSIVSSPNNYYVALRNYYNINLKNAIDGCNKAHTNPSLNHTLCVTTLTSNANVYTNNNRKSFAVAMQQSQCALDSRINVVLDCTFPYIDNALGSIGAATRQTEECIHNYLENKPQCDNNNVTVGANCSNVIDMQLSDVDFQNTTIQNPVRGLNRSHKCLQINFV